MAYWVEANRAFHRAVRDQAAALTRVYGAPGAYDEARRLHDVASAEDARLFAYNVELLLAEALGIPPDNPKAPPLGQEPPVWALPFLSASMLGRARALLDRMLARLRVPAAPRVDRVVRAYMDNRRDHPLALGLKVRQVQCLRWAAEGKSSRDIAAIIGISARTVDEHLNNACAKLGVRTRAQAVKIAANAGLLGADP